MYFDNQSDLHKNLEEAIKASENGDYEKAIEILNELLRLDPKNGRALIERGVAYNGLDDVDAAIKDFELARDLYPHVSIPYYFLGTLHEEDREYDLAVSEFKTAIRLSPEGDFFVIGDSFFRLGFIFMEFFNDCPNALDFFHKAVAAVPDDLNYIHYRGLCLFELDKHKEALEDFNKVIHLDPDFTEAYFGRGTTHSCLSNFQSAIEDYLVYLEVCRRDALGWYYLGNCYIGAGDKVNARKAWRKAKRYGEERAIEKLAENPL